jgi:hypothetical protein
MRISHAIAALSIILAGCSDKLPEKKWPKNIAPGIFSTTKDLRLLRIENVVSHGYDYYLQEKAPLGGRVVYEDIHVPAGTEIRLDDFVGITGTSSRSWYTAGEIVDKDSKAYGVSFLFDCYFGWDAPSEVTVPFLIRSSAPIDN